MIQKMINRISQLENRHQVIFSLIIGVAVVAFWRGAWGLFDAYFLPNHHFARLWSLMGLSVIILYVTDYLVKKMLD
jgi:hypothetical protein